jgi:cephalosporin hydroxylase
MPSNIAEHIEDPLSRSSYKGLGLQQRRETVDVFPKLIKNILPKRVIEIGTGMGGLSFLIHDNIKTFGELYTFDTHARHTCEVLLKEGVKFQTENIFIESDWNCYNIKEEWKSKLTISPKIIVCDGGNKKAEFNGLAKFLNSGDVIMLHDYSTDQGSFETLKVWNWLECQYSDIKETCEQYNLQPYMHEEFLNVAWGCFRKI